MTIKEARAAIHELLRECQETNEWGGAEDEYGTLAPGIVDWSELKTQIDLILEKITVDQS